MKTLFIAMFGLWFFSSLRASESRKATVGGWSFYIPESLQATVAEGFGAPKESYVSKAKGMWIEIYEGKTMHDFAYMKPNVLEEKMIVENQEVIWAVWKISSHMGTRYYARTFLPIFGPRKGKIEVFVGALSADDLVWLRQYIFSAEIQPKANQPVQTTAMTHPATATRVAPLSDF